MSGFTTAGLPAAVAPLTGLEQAAFDTQLTQGLAPESEAISIGQIAAFVTAASISTDNGTTQALTAAMVVPTNGVGTMLHTSSGGTTPTLTLPTAALIIAAAGPNFGIGTGQFRFTLINSNSGTATLAVGTGDTITGTATALTNTTRTFLVTQPTVGAVTFTSIGAGTV